MPKAQRVRSQTLQVEGLTELNKALKSLGPEFKGRLRDVSKSVAEFVAADSRSAAAGLGSVAAKSAPSIKATAGVKSAGVSFGGARYQFAAGAEFGSSRYKQFKPWRGRGADAGYFVYPTIRRDAARIQTDYAKALDDLLKKAFPD